MLAVLMSAMSLVFGTIQKVEWLSSYLSNIATGLIGSLIIILFIDRLLERERQKQGLRIMRVALNRLKAPIQRHMALLCEFYKAAALNKPSPLPSTFEEVFTDRYYTTISFLDFYKDAPVKPKVNWFEYVDLESRLFKDRLEKVEDMYSGFLEIDLIETLEGLVNSSFLKLLLNVKNYASIAAQHKKRIDQVFSGVRNFAELHVTLMMKLVKYHNSRVDSPIALNKDFWRDDVEPKWGSSRPSI